MEAAHDEPGRDEQHDRECDLRDQQRRARPQRTAARPSSAPPREHPIRLARRPPACSGTATVITATATTAAKVNERDRQVDADVGDAAARRRARAWRWRAPASGDHAGRARRRRRPRSASRRARARAMARRVAPSASRMLCSCRRRATRVSIRPETLAQAMSSSTPTAAQSTRSAGRTRPEDVVGERRDDRGRAPLQPSGRGAIEPRLEWRRVRRARPSWRDRDAPARQRRTRRACRGWQCWAGCRWRGPARSAPRIRRRAGTSTPGGMTPTISTGSPSSIIACRRCSGSAPKRRTQAP